MSSLERFFLLKFQHIFAAITYLSIAMEFAMHCSWNLYTLEETTGIWLSIYIFPFYLSAFICL